MLSPLDFRRAPPYNRTRPEETPARRRGGASPIASEYRLTIGDDCLRFCSVTEQMFDPDVNPGRMS
jgi:hypothetical protein